MCELLGLCFNLPVRPDISFRGFRHRGENNPDGWGIAFFPDESAVKSTFVCKIPLAYYAAQWSPTKLHTLDLLSPIDSASSCLFLCNRYSVISKYLFPVVHDSSISTSTAPISLNADSSPLNIPMTLSRLLISRFRRSTAFVVRNLRLMPSGSVMIAIASSKPASSLSIALGASLSNSSTTSSKSFLAVSISGASKICFMRAYSLP